MARTKTDSEGGTAVLEEVDRANSRRVSLAYHPAATIDRLSEGRYRVTFRPVTVNPPTAKGRKPTKFHTQEQEPVTVNADGFAEAFRVAAGINSSEWKVQVEPYREEVVPDGEFDEIPGVDRRFVEE